MADVREVREWLMLIAEYYLCGILTIEYFFGRSDTDIKKEESRKANRKKMTLPEQNLTDGEGK